MKRIAAVIGLTLVAAMVRNHLAVRDGLSRVAPDLRSPVLPYVAAPLTAKNLWTLRLIFKIRTRPGSDVTVTRRLVDESSVRTLVFMPKHRLTPSPAVLWIHGGGYVAGTPESEAAGTGRLVSDLGVVAVSPDYRLAPEHPFPAALDDVWAATSWAYAHAAGLGGSPDGFAVCGESAGGNLAAVVSQLARSSDSISIDRQILLQPVTDLTLSCPSIAMPETECLVPRADLAWYYRQYAGTGADLRAARLSPLWATDLEGLPPALIIAAEYDSLRDEADAYAQRLGAAGVEVRYRCYPGMVHGFLQMAGLVPDAQQAIDEIAAFLRR
jgi:acetyl esterase/lipase